MQNPLDAAIIGILPEIRALMAQAYAQVGSNIPPDHPLAQSGLDCGHEIVLDNIRHGERGVAFEHLLYMVGEPPLCISPACLATIIEVGTAMGYAPDTWKHLRVHVSAKPS